MPSLNQFAYVPGSTNYQWGYGGAIPNIPITGAPADTNWTRWAMLNDGTTYRLYFFKGSTNNTLYQFGFDGTSYAYGHNSIPVLTLINIPADADMDSFAMLWDGANYRLYVKRLGFPTTLYQAAYVPGSTNYQFGYQSIPSIAITGFPANTDWSRWSMLHDGTAYRIYAMQLGSNTQLLQGSFNAATSTYQYAYNSIPVLNLVNTPANSNLAAFAMLFGQNAYRLYFQTL
ncbi:hypothetical protein ACFOWM_12210 [Ferruginibacter yonginensis]|uniref:Uncharacterized protein n=1 Tax=Ferruginibacter yonginensis TaxID=1310416 RepID=A0ABV8QU56_9BACT